MGQFLFGMVDYLTLLAADRSKVHRFLDELMEIYLLDSSSTWASGPATSTSSTSFKQLTMDNRLCYQPPKPQASVRRLDRLLGLTGTAAERRLRGHPSQTPGLQVRYSELEEANVHKRRQSYLFQWSQKAGGVRPSGPKTSSPVLRSKEAPSHESLRVETIRNS